MAQNARSIEGESDVSRTLSEVERILAGVAAGADHYQVLGLPRDAPIESIRRAYRDAVDTLHPLKHRDSMQRSGVLHWKMSQAFLRVVEAFSTLSRAGRRVEYDAQLERKPTLPLPLPAVARSLEGGETSSVAVPREASANKSVIGSAYGSASYSGPVASDRRRAQRYALIVPVRVTPQTLDWQEVTKSENLSRCGARFRISHPVTPGDLLHVELPIPHELRPSGSEAATYLARAIVRNTVESDSGNIVGIEFLQLSEAGSPRA
jgi:curved DNA-binding protein CbpA